MELKIGAHLSAQGGFTNPLKRIKDIGGNSLQIFSSSPRTWNLPHVLDEEADEFKKLKDELGVIPVYFHASYLINLGDTSRIGHLSKKLLIEELKVASKMGVKGSIIHPGSFKDRSEEPAFKNPKYDGFLKNITEVLKQAPKDTLLIIENAGMRKIGKRIDEIERIIKDVGDKRLRACLDTCHLHAAGYDISTEKKLDNFLDDFDKRIGLGKLELWHINDSRDPFGSFRDRHENIGEGEIGLETFRLLFNHPKTKSSPFIIETPGFDGLGPDKKNLDILKGLIDR